MSTMQWEVRVTPEQRKNSKQAIKIFAISIYSTGLIYCGILYFMWWNKIESFDFMKFFLAGFYVVEILAWHLFIKKWAEAKDKIITLTDNFIEVKEPQTKKIKQYSWDKFKSFSKSNKIYDKMERDISKSFHPLLFLEYAKKQGEINYFILECGTNNKDEVYNFLKTKLEERS